MPDPTHPPTAVSPPPEAAALVQAGRWLQSQGYHFTTPTPSTHALVLERRPDATARDVRDVFGWNLPFAPGLLPADRLAALLQGAVVQPWADGLLRAAVRFSTLGPLLLPHSRHPTTDNASVFFGPDTYRFAALIQRTLGPQPLPDSARILDMGCGTGAGGLVAAGHTPTARTHLTLADISPLALRFARASADLAGQAGVEFRQGDLFGSVHGSFDLIVANPPYLNDDTQRLYRHGGGRWGEALSIRILREGYPRLAPGGRLLLYTGSAISRGVDHLRQALQADLAGLRCRWSYEEIDPDVFGEELLKPAYADVDRIAAVGLVVHKP